MSTGKKTEKLNYDKNKEKSSFFKSREKEGSTGLSLLSAFFIPLKNLLAGKGGK